MDLIDIRYEIMNAFRENGITDENGQFVPNRRKDDSFFIPESKFSNLQKEFLKHKGATTLDLDPSIRSGLEIITFKKQDNCFTNGGISYKRHDGKIVTELINSITLIGGYVIDLNTGVNGMPVTKYLEALYELNNRDNIRIDYTMSSFMSYEDEDAFTQDMCSYLSTRDGLSYSMFMKLWNAAKEMQAKRQEAKNAELKVYNEDLTLLNEKFKDSKRGMNVVKYLHKENYVINDLHINVNGNVNILCADGTIKQYTSFVVAVTDNFEVLDPTHGWQTTPIDVWLSMINVMNPLVRDGKLLDKSPFKVTFSDISIFDYLELKTYGDFDSIKGENNCIYSKCKDNHLSLLIDMLEKCKSIKSMDISSIMATLMFSADRELTERVTKFFESNNVE